MMFGPVHVTLWQEGVPVGDTDIGFWSVGRQEVKTNAELVDDEEYTYTWAVSRKTKSGGTEQFNGEVRHRYGDGWIELTRKVFEAAREQEVG